MDDRIELRLRPDQLDDIVNDLVLRETKLNKLAAWLQHVQEENE